MEASDGGLFEGDASRCFGGVRSWGGTRAVALRFHCIESWVRRVKQERREQGKTAPATPRRRVPLWAPYRERIEQAIAEHPDMTLQELKEELQTDLSRQTLCTALKKLKLTLKKSIEGRRTSSTRCGREARLAASATSGPRSRAVGFHR